MQCKYTRGTAPDARGLHPCVADAARLHPWRVRLRASRRVLGRSHQPACLRRRRLVSPPTRLAYYAAAIGCLRLRRPAGLRRRRLVFLPTRLAYYAAAVGRLRLHRRPASVAADWCPRLYGWLVTPPFMGVHVFADRLAFAAADWCFCLYGWRTSPLLMGFIIYTIGLVPLAPTGVFVTIDGLLRSHIGYFCCHRGNITKLRMDQSEHHHRLASTAADWCFRLHGWHIMPPLLGVYVFTDRLAFAAADWCFRLHGWPLCRRCWASTSSPTGLPSPPPTGVSAYTAGLLCRRCWASTSSPIGLPSPLPTGVSACTADLYAAVVGRLRLHRPACLRRRRLVFPPARLAYYAAVVGRLRLHRPACLRRRRLVFPPARLAYYAAVVGRLRLHRPACLRRRRLVFPPARLAYYAAVVGRLRLHRPACLRRCRLVFPPARLAFMPPLLGVYVFTDRLAFAAADWCFRLHGWPLCRRCWASTSSPTGRLVRRRLVLPPARLAYYAAVVGRLRLHRPAASTAADWCFRLHGWPIMPPLLGVYVFTDRPPRSLPTGVSACTLAYYAAVVGHLRLHRPAASSAADWCFRLHGWPIMPPLLGVYVFTDRPPRPPPTGGTACTAGLL
uniref:cysteine dioxygenase n=1 Tax=Oryza sativa subsp. japonica TaxID=39947 RepID=Q64M80_ORYSJ|nr:HGWP repeat containing protein-like [Oryza sativa Japonica Group]